ncbi:MAG: class I SAM-dependent methyltransferase [Flavobacteriaceae bacterium]|nr:class I SAM-dependent methyltransferase [Flavobacteriaceae bacterium]
MQIASKLKSFIKEIKSKNLELVNHSKKADDIYALTILQPLLNGLPYLPFNGGALRPICLAYILNEIIINQRRMILELGSGLSTILMARLIKINNLKAKIISVENNYNWSIIIKNYLEKEDLLQYVEIIRADLKTLDTKLGQVQWYDYSLVSKSTTGCKFDFVIIDGPNANTETIKYSRVPALFKFKDKLEEDYCIVLDDSNRKGEQEIIRLFRNENKDINFSLVGETLAVFRKNLNFNPIPIHY